MSEEFPHGPCECDAGCTVHEERGPGPAAYSVERDGKTYKVCSRCYLTGDHNKTLLCTRESCAPHIVQDLANALGVPVEELYRADDVVQQDQLFCCMVKARGIATPQPARN